MTKATKATPEGYHSVTPILTLDDTRKAIAWYKEAFGAEEIYVATGPNNLVMHALVRIGNSSIMMHDTMPGDKGPKAYGGSPAGLWIYTEDCDGLFNRAVKAGGKVGMAMADMFWGDRFGFITDPFGYGWGIATHKEDLTPQELGERKNKAFAMSPDCK